MNTREALKKLEAVGNLTPEFTLMKMIIKNQILLEDRIYVIEKKLGIR